MGSYRYFHLGVGWILIILFLFGCGAPVNTPTPIPPTATETTRPPTSTPTSAPATATATTVQPTEVPTPTFTLATSIMDVVGSWSSLSRGLYMRFYEDGTLHNAYSLDRLENDPYAINEIWFEGTQMHLREREVFGVPSCKEYPAIYEVHIFEDGSIRIVKIEDKCSPRARDTSGEKMPVMSPTPAFTLATSIMEVVGSWSNPSRSLYISFYEDGTMHQAHSIDGLENNPYAISEFWFEGTQMYTREKELFGVPSCGDDPAIYEIRLFADGSIQIVKIEDKCSPRVRDTAGKRLLVTTPTP